VEFPLNAAAGYGNPVGCESGGASAMQDFSVIVVGAGPAGCAAAYDLAEAGVSVLLLDRKAFPRLKPCAGALSIKAVKRLRYPITPVIRWVARDLDVRLNGGGKRRFEGPDPIAVMTVRQEFDAYCLEQAIRKGAVFRKIGDLDEIGETEASVSVTLQNGQTLHCRYLIGADGANSRVRRLLGYETAPIALALEGNVPLPQCRDMPTMRFDFGYVPGGYGWVFPKGDSVNVGLYAHQPAVKLAKNDLLAYAKHATGAETVEAMVGYPIALGGEFYDARHQRILLAGDAAGMSEPLLGEGIHNALVSGQAAARAVLAAVKDGKNAQAEFRDAIYLTKRDLRACRIAAHWFYDLHFLGLARWFPIPRSKALMKGFAAGLTFREIMRNSLRSPAYTVHPIEAVTAFEHRAA